MLLMQGEYIQVMDGEAAVATHSALFTQMLVQ